MATGPSVCCVCKLPYGHEGWCGRTDYLKLDKALDIERIPSPKRLDRKGKKPIPLDLQPTKTRRFPQSLIPSIATIKQVKLKQFAAEYRPQVLMPLTRPRKPRPQYLMRLT